jgi:hypothetical protein
MAAPLRAQKTDVLTLPNGDRITGEIKGVSAGKLTYSTDDAGTLSVEWVKVARLTSTHFFEVELTTGRKYFGRLPPSPTDGALIVAAGRADTVRVVDVVAVTPIDAGFFQRVKAYLDVGFSFAKANQATTLNTSGEVDYRGQRFGSTLAFSTYLQGQESTEATSRWSTSLQGRRLLPDRWQIGIVGEAEHNEELDLALRLVGGAGVGRVLRQTNSDHLETSAGLALAKERFYLESGTGDTVKTNLEGLLSTRWDVYRFDSPKLDLGFALKLYPGLSQLGRIRGEFTTRVQYEVFKDFFVGVNFTDTFDSEPPEPEAPKNDYVTSLTIGWSYRR